MYNTLLHFYFHLLFLNLLATKQFFLIGIHSIKAEQPPQVMELQENEVYRKISLGRTYSLKMSVNYKLKATKI